MALPADDRRRSAASDRPGGGVYGEVARGAWGVVVLLCWVSFAVERINRRRR